MKTQNKKYRISIKKLVCTIFVILGGVVGILMILGNQPTLSHVEKNYKTIYVSSGETLWQIATRESNNNLYYSGKDIRYVINDIKKINNLESSYLSNNQELVIPQI